MDSDDLTLQAKQRRMWKYGGPVWYECGPGPWTLLSRSFTFSYVAMPFYRFPDFDGLIQTTLLPCYKRYFC